MTFSAKKFRLGDLVSFVSGGTPSKQVEAYWGGETPWVSAKDLKSLHITSSIDTLSDEGRAVAALVPSGTLLILVRGMSLFKTIPLGIAVRELAINQDIKGLLPNEKVSSEFLAYSILAREDAILQMVEAAGHGTGRLNTDALKDLVFRVPPREEQARIVAVFASWEKAQETLAKLIQAKRRALAILRERYLGEPDEAVFTKLSSVTRECADRNRSRLGRDAIMAVTKQSGMRPMREETIAESIDRYKVVHPNAFAYNPMRLNIGSIAKSQFPNDVLVSPDYVVFECQEAEILPGYLDHLRQTKRWMQHFEVAGNGSVRVRIYYDDLGAFSFGLPPLAVQERVVRALDAALLELSALNEYADAVDLQKRGLMQKLLSGEWHLSMPVAEVA